jgi:nitrite reductase/ring-hydroxylating ferredoxin subunit/uncharacterized membrane protein
MRSTASFKGHPIHPALIPFPLAFLTGALVFDVLGVMLGEPSFWATGSYLIVAGVLSALAAAVPGAIDYVRTVPPASTGKHRATKHAAVNLTATAAFAAAWVIRGGAAAEPGPALLALELLGAALLGVGGWMGGTLTFRNQIGVDHRYAGAGRWKQERFSAEPGQAVAVARRDELGVNQMKLVEIDGHRVVVARTEDGHVAFDDHCTHRGGSLAGGVMICGTVQCPWHGSQFDTRTGALRAGPAERAIRTYRVEESGEEVRLRIGETPAAPAPAAPPG